MDPLEVAFWVGFARDALLQIITYMRGNLAGLREYFQMHGRLEAMCIAAGTTWLALRLFIAIGLPFEPLPLFLWGAALDVMWRQAHMMKTLNRTYYRHMSWWWSIICAGISLAAVWAVCEVINK